jgi:hypothetical protein
MDTNYILFHDAMRSHTVTLAATAALFSDSKNTDDISIHTAGDAPDP